jgi:hypothetical protein
MIRYFYHKTEIVRVFVSLIPSISVSAILVARNVITLCRINTRTLYHGPSTTDVPHTCALVARAKVKWHHTHISTGCSDVMMLRLFLFYTLDLRHIHVKIGFYIYDFENVLMLMYRQQDIIKPLCVYTGKEKFLVLSTHISRSVKVSALRNDYYVIFTLPFQFICHFIFQWPHPTYCTGRVT